MGAALCQQRVLWATLNQSHTYSVPGTMAKPNHTRFSQQLTEAAILDSIFWLEKLRHRVPTLCPTAKKILEAMVLTQPIKY